MANNKPRAVTADDLLRYAENESDFGFELKVLKLLTDIRLHCIHSGTYVDSVTGKDRQFDIRAVLAVPAGRFLLAVECKNVRESSPLLVSCSPRRREEAFHYVLAGMLSPVSRRIPSPRSYYKEGEPVGKSAAQVGVNSNDEFTKQLDREFHDKWAQSLASARGMMENGRTHVGTRGWANVIMIPITVVPDGRLWAAKYSHDGDLISPPEAADRVSYFVAQGLDAPSYDAPYLASHVEFMTLEGLRREIENMKSMNAVDVFFDLDE